MVTRLTIANRPCIPTSVAAHRMLVHCQKCNTFSGHHLYSSQMLKQLCYKHYNKHNKDIT